MENCEKKKFYYAIENTCKTCFETCKSCDGIFPKNCLTCELGLYFYKGFCLVECPQMTNPETQGMTLRCIELAGSTKGTLNLSIIDSTFNGLVEEQNNFFFSGTVSYDGNYDLKITWSLIAEGLTREDYNALQVLAFTRNELRKDRLVAGISVIDIPNYELIKDKMMVEMVIQAGSDYKAEYLPFRMIPRPIGLKFEPSANSFDFASNITLNIKVSYAIKSMPVGAICLLKYGDSQIILRREVHFEADIDQQLQVPTPPLPTGVYNLSCSLFGSNTSQLVLSTLVTIAQDHGFTAKGLTQTYLDELAGFTGLYVSTSKELMLFVDWVQRFHLSTKTARNPNHICLSDTGCFGRGSCIRGIKDNKYCSCDGGFNGANCLFSAEQHKLISRLANQSFRLLQTELNDKYRSTRFTNVKTIATLTQLLKFTEFVELESLKLSIDYLNRLVSNSTISHISMVPTMTNDNLELLFEFIDKILDVMQYMVGFSQSGQERKRSLQF